MPIKQEILILTLSNAPLGQLMWRWSIYRCLFNSFHVFRYICCFLTQYEYYGELAGENRIIFNDFEP